MAESEIISALNSLRSCLESQLMVTNQIVEEFKSSLNSHFVSLQYNNLSPGYSSPPGSSHSHGHPPPTNPSFPLPNPSPPSSRGSSPNDNPSTSTGFKPYPNIAIKVPPPPSANPTLHVKRLSQAETKDKRDCGFCYNCNEKGASNHQCKGKYHLLIGDDEEENSPIQEDHHRAKNVVVVNTEVVVSPKLETESVEVSTCEFKCKIEANKEEKLKTSDAYFAHDTHMLPSFIDINPINCMLAKEENVGERIMELDDFPLLLLQEFGEKINFVVEQLAHVARRRTTFKLYALKEVYVKYLNLHLEDKVILKGRRVDTIMLWIILVQLFK